METDKDMESMKAGPSGGGSGRVTGQSRVMVDSRDIAKKFTDLKLASDTRPPNFSGAANDPVDDFVRRFQRIGKALEWTDAQLLQQAPIYLTDFAANWWDKETQDGSVVPWGT